MSPPLTAVYAGTFDPITLGHEDIVRRSVRLFGRVIVAVAVGHHKKALFSIDQRLSMARHALCDCPGVEVAAFDGLLRDFVLTQQAQVVVRGVRSVTDFDYERQLAGMNRSLMPGVETLFLLPDDRYQYVSSTLVREIATLGGDVGAFVSETVHQRLLEKLRGAP
ncbi:MAG: pantetheine-phosphate adenylyltransferase [Rhodoferax sp.]|nr:pantetheine-phosphate adenylyltransferase [Rhodoferax sp.]